MAYTNVRGSPTLPIETNLTTPIDGIWVDIGNLKFPASNRVPIRVRYGRLQRKHLMKRKSKRL